MMMFVIVMFLQILRQGMDKEIICQDQPQEGLCGINKKEYAMSYSFYFYIRDKKLIKEEFGYMHFQQREMEMDPSVLKLDKFKIIPNKFVPLEVVEVNINNFNTIIKNGHPHQYLQIISKRIKRKIKKLLDII